MAALKTALVLAVSVAAVVGWETPAIPAGRRTQYHLQRRDGAYSFGYDTGDGHSAKAVADPHNQVQGEYSYLDGGGQRVNLKYTAGRGGFVPTTSATGGAGASSAHSASASGAGFASRGHSGVLPAQADPHHDPNADASYNFLIDTPTYRRSEAADARGNVRGQYSYASPAGSQTVNYVAGEGTGFVVTGGGAGAPRQKFSLAPIVVQDADTGFNANPDGSFSFAYSTPGQGHQAAADQQGNVRGSYSFVGGDGVSRTVDYTAGAGQGFVARGAHLPSTADVHTRASSSQNGGYHYHTPAQHDAYAETGGDASYSYSYDAGNSVKHETSDAQGNVQGSYALVDADGNSRRVDYTARKNEGFVVSGVNRPGTSGATAGATAGATGQHHTLSPSSLPHNAFAHPDLIANPNAAGSAGTGQVAASKNGAYSYSYTTGSGGVAAPSLKASSGSNTFGVASPKTSLKSFPANQGAATGHVTATKGGEYSYSYTTGGGGHTAVNSGASLKATHGSGPAINLHYASPVSTAGATGQVTASKPGEYSYSYTTGGQGGKSTLKSSLGQAANFGTSGFSTSGTSSSGTGKVTASKPGEYAYSFSTGGHDAFSSSALKPSFAPREHHNFPDIRPIYEEPEETGDRSYSYSYNTDTSSKQETSDVDGNVFGIFSYVGPDGVNRKLSYTARKGSGFLATGDHLPSAETPVGIGGKLGWASSAVDTSRYLSPGVGGNQKFGYTFDTKV